MLVREQVLQGVGSRKMGIKHYHLSCGVGWQPLLRQGMLHPAHQHGNVRLREDYMAAMPERVYTYCDFQPQRQLGTPTRQKS